MLGQLGAPIGFLAATALSLFLFYHLSSTFSLAWLCRSPSLAPLDLRVVPLAAPLSLSFAARSPRPVLSCVR